MFRINCTEEIEGFFDKYITTDKTLLLEAHKLTSVHIHVEKRSQLVCRFHYPLPPMKKTMVLEDMNECNLSF